VRRHHIRGVIGLPLIVGSRIVGLLYLDYAERGGQPIDVHAPKHLARVSRAADELALTLDSSRRTEETRILRAMGELAAYAARLPSRAEDPDSVVRHIDEVLKRVVGFSGLGCAALYVLNPADSRLRLVANMGCPSLSGHAGMLEASVLADPRSDPVLAQALSEDGLKPVLSVRSDAQYRATVLVLADGDSDVIHRQLPAQRLALQAASDILAGLVNSAELLEVLGGSNRTLGAVTRLSERLLRPGASQQGTLDNAVALLTDEALPELDFELADIFLLEGTPDGRLAVCASSGAATSPRIHARTDDRGTGHRTPSWAAPGYRVLDPHDVLAYVARRRRTVVVAAQAAREEQFVTGYPDDLLVRKQIQITRADGGIQGYVRAARLRESADRAPLSGGESAEPIYQLSDQFTLNGEIFDAYEHGSLVRVFVPFGLDGEGMHATGVLEAGFHITTRRHLERVQIEALRACAATIAAAVETARLYEDVARRAQQLEIVSEVSRTIATSIDLEQTLTLISNHMARALETSVCLIALLEEDGSAWYGAASSTMEEVWHKRRVERPDPSIVFEVVDRGRPMVVEDAENHPLISAGMVRTLGIRSLIALPLMTPDGPLGAVVLGQQERMRTFTEEEVERAAGLTDQAAMAIRNARLHAREEEEHHIQKDVILVGFGQWGQKAYRHLELLKNFFNFRTHIVELEWPGRREALAEAERHVLENGDLFHWDQPNADAPGHVALARELEASCYVITYICTPAESHLPMLRAYYDLSNVVLIEKPLGAPPEEYREFLSGLDDTVQIVAADHYWFKLEIRLLEQLLTEEQNLRAFLDQIEDVEIEILEEQPPSGSGAQIGMIADLVPHAFAIMSLLTPLDRLKLADERPLQIGRYQPESSEFETFARLRGAFDHRGRSVSVTIDVGKGVTNAKWIKLSGARHKGGRRAFYKFDFGKGEAIDGTQSTLRAATRPIRQPGVPDNAHLNMLRHVIEKKNPAVGILTIHEAIRANARIQELERMARELMEAEEWTPYSQGQRPTFDSH
jgi:GAF domain-containing protein